MVFFLHIKSLPNLLFGVLCLPGDQSHPFAQPTNPLACCICWAGLLGHAVFPTWNEGPNFGSYIRKWGSDGMRKRRGGALRNLTFISQIPSLLLFTLLYALKTHLIGSLTLWTPREFSQKEAEQEIRERKIRASVS